MYEDLVLATEKLMIESISKYLQDNVIMQGSNLDLNASLDVLRSLYECKRLGAPKSSAKEHDVTFPKLVRGLFQSAAMMVYEKISMHVGTFAFSASKSIPKFFSCESKLDQKTHDVNFKCIA